METLEVTRITPMIAHVILNRPNKLNAMSLKMFAEIREAFLQIALDPEVRVVILSGKGRMFTSGIDCML